MTFWYCILIEIIGAQVNVAAIAGGAGGGFAGVVIVAIIAIIVILIFKKKKSEYILCINPVTED